MRTPGRGFPAALDRSQSNSSGHERVLTDREKQERYEQNLREYEALASRESDYLDENPLNPAADYPYHEQPSGRGSSSANNGERPLTRQEQEAKLEEHIRAHSALSLADTDTNNGERPLTREEQEAKLAKHIREHSTLQLDDTNNEEEGDSTLISEEEFQYHLAEQEALPLPAQPLVSPYYPSTFVPYQQPSTLVPRHLGSPMPPEPVAFSSLSPAANPYFNPSPWQYRTLPPALQLPAPPSVSPYYTAAFNPTFDPRFQQHSALAPVHPPLPPQLPYPPPPAFNPAFGPVRPMIKGHQPSTVPSFPVSPFISSPASSSSYVSMLLELQRRDSSPPASAPSGLSDAEYAQILAAEEEEYARSRSVPSGIPAVMPAATLTEMQNIQLKGKNICRNTIDASQQKDYAELEKIWLDVSNKSVIRRILAVLNHYTSNNNVLLRVVEGKWNRNNIPDVEQIINYITAVPKAGKSLDKSSDALSQEVLNRLNEITLNNEKGTLATVIQFLTQKIDPVRQQQTNVYRSGY